LQKLNKELLTKQKKLEKIEDFQISNLQNEITLKTE
ncbi:uncharacterized protein LOC106159218, partial [Lingula anatina]|uniref:Uncharacterized protein LOC106159218 n=1 Tax=Lingula anatina TaxID=7574 RepID=A0A1S3HXY4_LINAN